MHVAPQRAGSMGVVTTLFVTLVGHAEQFQAASYFPESAGSAGSRVAYMPRSPQLAIFVRTTTDI